MWYINRKNKSAYPSQVYLKLGLIVTSSQRFFLAIPLLVTTLIFLHFFFSKLAFLGLLSASVRFALHCCVFLGVHAELQCADGRRCGTGARCSHHCKLTLESTTLALQAYIAADLPRVVDALWYLSENSQVRFPARVILGFISF